MSEESAACPVIPVTMDFDGKKHACAPAKKKYALGESSTCVYPLYKMLLGILQNTTVLMIFLKIKGCPVDLSTDDQEFHANL